MNSTMKTVVTTAVTGVATIAALLTVMAFSAAAVWEFTVALDFVEQRIEQRMERQMTERLTRLEAKVLDQKEDDEASPVDESVTEQVLPGHIEIGQLQEGFLDENDPQMVDGSHYDDWLLSVSDSATIILDMRSEEIDSFVFLAKGQREDEDWEIIDANDDSGENLDARLMVDVVPGVYTIVANTYGTSTTGPYTLEVRLIE